MTCHANSNYKKKKFQIPNPLQNRMPLPLAQPFPAAPRAAHRDTHVALHRSNRHPRYCVSSSVNAASYTAKNHWEV